MKQKHHRSLLALASAWAMAWAVSPTAHAQVMAQSKVSVSGLKITLIDLNTADGIAPSVTVMGNLAGFASGQRQLEVGMGTLIPSSPGFTYMDGDTGLTPQLSLQSQLRGGRITVPTTPAGTTLTLGSTLSASTSADLSRASTSVEDLSYSYPDLRYNPTTEQFDYGYETFSGQRTTQGVASDAVIGLFGQPVEDGEEPPYLRVSANTLVVLEGTATLSSTVDARRVMALQASDPNLKTDLNGGTNAQLMVSLAFDDYFYPTEPGMAGNGSLGGISSFNQALGLGYDMYGFYSNTGADSQEFVSLENPTLSQSGLLTLQKTNTFRVSLGNASTDFRTMTLDMQMASVSEHLTRSLSAPGAVFTLEAPTVPEVPEVPTVPNIPEPGTWAQMGLGLIALVAAVRRRRARA
jgi:PEP-CTERM motif